MRRRNALHHSDKTLCMPKLRPVPDSSRTHRDARSNAATRRDRRRAETETTQRILEMVAQQQEEIARETSRSNWLLSRHASSWIQVLAKAKVSGLVSLCLRLFFQAKCSFHRTVLFCVDREPHLLHQVDRPDIV